MIVDNDKRIIPNPATFIKPDIQRMRSLIHTIAQGKSNHKYLVTCENDKILHELKPEATKTITMVDELCNSGHMFDVGVINSEDIDDNCRVRVNAAANDYRHPYIGYVITSIQDGIRFFSLIHAEDIRHSTLLPFFICSFCYGPTEQNIRYIVRGKCVGEGFHSDPRGFAQDGTEWDYMKMNLTDNSTIMCMLLEMLRHNCPGENVSLSNSDKQSLRTRGNPLPISPYRLQDTAYYSTILRPRIIAQYEAKGGTHASPIPHDRRGHIRRYKSGKESWVNATRVNGGKDILESGRSHYKVDMELT